MNYKDIIYQQEQIISMQAKAYPYIIHTNAHQNSTKLVRISGLYKYLTTEEDKYFKDLFLNRKYTETEFKTIIQQYLKGHSYSFYRTGDLLTKIEVSKKRVPDDEANQIINNLTLGLSIQRPQLPQVIKEEPLQIIKSKKPSPKPIVTQEVVEHSGSDHFKRLVQEDAVKKHYQR